MARDLRETSTETARREAEATGQQPAAQAQADSRRAAPAMQEPAPRFRDWASI